MKPGPFILAFAALARFDEKTLPVHARALRDAGILPKGGRGASALEVDHHYMAKLLISRLGTDKPARGVEAFNRLAGMQLVEPHMLDAFRGTQLADDHTALDFMTMICDPNLTLKSEDEFTVEVILPALIEVKSEKYHLIYQNRAEWNALVKQVAETRDDPEKRALLEAETYFSETSLQGVTESRSFTSTWLQAFKNFAFHPLNKG